MHDVDDEDGEIAKRGASRSQVGERLVTWGVDDEEAWDFQSKLFSALHDLDMMRQVLLREVRRANLLRDTTSFIRLNVRLSQLVKDERLSRVDVTHDTDDRAS